MVPEDAAKITIRLAHEPLARFDAIAHKKGMSRSALIRQLIERYES
jgi:metal-responsive CopG/Arc/MetJ family transcriptional regulator